MDDDAAFVTRLIGFGLSEKEARTYLHLLKYGLRLHRRSAKSLKTYREDVHRTLTELIEKAWYAPRSITNNLRAVDLNTCARSRTQEAGERAPRDGSEKSRSFRNSQRVSVSAIDEVSTFKIIKSVKEVVLLP